MTNLAHIFDTGTQNALSNVFKNINSKINNWYQHSFISESTKLECEVIYDPHRQKFSKPNLFNV